MARKVWTGLIAGAGLLLAVAGSPAFGDTPITVRAAAQQGYARLVFQGASDLIKETRIAGNVLYIQFKTPVSLDTREPVRALDSYISAARLSPGGSVLSLTLRKSVLLRTSDLGDAAMVDLIETAGELNQGKPVRVRVGEHGTFDRIVFDWPERVDYTVRQVGRSVELTFDAETLPDFSQLYADPPPLLRSAEVEPEGEGIRVMLNLSGPADVRDFREGARVVIDLHAREADPDLPAAEAAEPQEAESAPAPVAAPVTQAPVPGEMVAEDSPAPEAEAAAAPVKLEVSAIATGTRLRLALDEEVPAAVFSRAGHLWLVLAGHYDIDTSALKSAGESLLGAAEVTHQPGATIMRVGMDPAFQVISRRLNDSWEADLTLYPAAPLAPLQVSRQENETLGPIVFIPVDQPADIIEVGDPEVGDRLAILPLLGNGAGLVEERRFISFSLLKTAQGLAIQLIGDGLKLTRFENGIAISGGRGLALGAAAAGEDGDAPTPILPEKPVPFVDFAAWKRGTDAEYQTIRAALMQRLSLADDNTRNDRRFDLAKFYLANGLATEALGYLELMQEDDPGMAQDPHVLAVRGIAEYRMGRLAPAEADLAAPALAGDPHVGLWRAVVAAGLEKWQDAYDFYRQGLEVLATYDEAARARFQLAAVKAARHIGDMETARRELMVLSNYELPAQERSEVKLLLGEVYEEEGASDKALAAYDDAIAEDYRPTRVRAEFNRVDELVKQDAISREEAINELERLRYVWRGDDLELKCLRLLGQLYLKGGQYREALSRMRSAVTQFNGTADARELAREMGDVFRKLYLGGGTDAMPPIRALALYYDFRELTPIGYEGDQMIRRLADRLVKVELLDKAAELLEHQVTFRLEGAAKAQVAENLAVVYLLDHKPEQALKAIRDTEQPQLPDDITTRRRHLEARALTDLNRFDEADALLKDDTSPEAVALKADLYWQAEDWTKAAEASRTLINNQLAAGKGSDYRQILRLAVSTSLAGDTRALPRLADEFGDTMKTGPYARTFDLITSATPTSGDELRDIINSVGDVSSYETYLADYKDELSTAQVQP